MSTRVRARRSGPTSASAAAMVPSAGRWTRDCRSPQPTASRRSKRRSSSIGRERSPTALGRRFPRIVSSNVSRSSCERALARLCLCGRDGGDRQSLWVRDATDAGVVLSGNPGRGAREPVAVASGAVRSRPGSGSYGGLHCSVRGRRAHRLPGRSRPHRCLSLAWLRDRCCARASGDPATAEWPVAGRWLSPPDPAAVAAEPLGALPVRCCLRGNLSLVYTPDLSGCRRGSPGDVRGRRRRAPVCQLRARDGGGPQRGELGNCSVEGGNRPRLSSVSAVRRARRSVSADRRRDLPRRLLVALSRPAPRLGPQVPGQAKHPNGFARSSLAGPTGAQRCGGEAMLFRGSIRLLPGPVLGLALLLQGCSAGQWDLGAASKAGAATAVAQAASPVPTTVDEAPTVGPALMSTPAPEHPAPPTASVATIVATPTATPEIAAAPAPLIPLGGGPAVGQPAPDFTLVGLDGKTIRLSDFRGQPVVVTFFATWCGPCTEELPRLQATYQKDRAKGLQVLLIDLKEPPAE